MIACHCAETEKALETVASPKRGWVADEEEMVSAWATKRSNYDLRSEVEH